MRKLFPALIFFIFSLTPSHVLSQMFSVGNTVQRNSLPTTFIRAGYMPVDFVYTGNLTGNNRPDGLEFSHPGLFFSFETPGFELSMGFANNLVGLDEVRYFDLSLTLSNQFALIRSQRFAAGIPVQLYSNLTSVNNDREANNFNQANFGIGGGAFFSVRPGSKIRFTNEFTPGYGFSSSNGGFFGGSMFYVRGSSRLNLYDIIGNTALSLGYNFNFRSFDVDQQLYDFDYTSHTISLGISF